MAQRANAAGRAQDRLASGAGVSEEVLANPFYPRNVVVHPLVLLSTVDHFLRVNPKGGKGRVVGVLLGEVYQGRVDVTNSFAGARPAARCGARARVRAARRGAPAARALSEPV